MEEAPSGENLQYQKESQKISKLGQLEQKLTPEVANKIIENERREWKKILGVDTEVLPLPNSVTPDVIGNLKILGMELRFVPRIDYGTKDDVNKKAKTLSLKKGIVDVGIQNYLKNFEKKYPNLHQYESLLDSQKRDPSISRNLSEWYWNSIKSGEINFPNLSGKWIAVETIPKPDKGENYTPSTITEILGFKDRFNVSWNNANDAINKEKEYILLNAGLDNGNVRMLEAVEWNLLANREGWGKTDSYEWTNTGHHEFFMSQFSINAQRITVGSSTEGGAASASYRLPMYPENNVGFRIAIVL